VVLITAPCCATSEVSPRADWNAKWIDHPTAPLREPMVFHFRKKLELRSKPATYLVHVSADNRFILFVNGERVGEGPARGDLQHWRYETFDLAAHLHPGANLIAATVWNFGIYSAMAQMSDRTAFLVEGDTAAEAAINTNSSWEVEEELGQNCLPRPMNQYKDYFVAGPGEKIDAAKYDWSWATGANGPNSHWLPAGPAMRESVLFDGSHPLSHDHKNDTPWLLEPDQLPPMLYKQESPGKTVRTNLPGAEGFPAAPVEIPAHKTINLLIALDAVTTAYPQLVVSGGEGSSVKLTYAGALYDAQGKKGIRTDIGDQQALGLEDEFYPDGGQDRVFEPLWWRGYRFLNITVHTEDEPLTLKSLRAFFSAYPLERKAYFRSDDAELNHLWDVAWYTATLNAHETYVDSAAVEQLQYVADMRPQLMVSYAVTGDDRLARQAIREIDYSRIPEGLTLSRYPSNIFQVITCYSLLWIGMVHDYWTWRDDPAFVNDRLLGTRTVLYWFDRHQGEDGMLTRLPFNNWQDWIAKDDRSFPPEDTQGRSALISLEYVWALRQAAELETTFGYKDLAAEYRQRADRAAAGIYKLCWDEKAGLLADTPDRNSFSQQANAFAVMTDTIPKERQKDVLHRMMPELFEAPASVAIAPASYYFQFYVARAMEHAGMSDDYLKLLDRWRAMLHRGFTTFPETPEPTREEAQGWGSHPSLDLLTVVAGIHPEGHGFKQVRIEPALGPLKSLEAAVASPSGLIRVKYQTLDQHLKAEVSLPENMTGVFVWRGATHELHGGEQQLTF